jgi:hypothetical protein
MGVALKLLGQAVVLTAVGVLMLTAAAAAADPFTDSRLIFDPGALDRTLGSDGDHPRMATKPANETAAQTSEQIWIPDIFKLPSFEDGSFISKSLAEGFAPVKNQPKPPGANVFQPRVTLGTLSIGLETETSIKQRSLTGDRDKDPERDTILDQKRQRDFLPFIGLSAKSNLQ